MARKIKIDKTKLFELKNKEGVTYAIVNEKKVDNCCYYELLTWEEIWKFSTFDDLMEFVCSHKFDDNVLYFDQIRKILYEGLKNLKK